MTTGAFEVVGVSAAYGRIPAIHDVSLTFRAAELCALVGSNGAGKSTLLKVISGILRPTQGCLTWRGDDITNTSVRQRVQLGVVSVPEGRRVFPDLTVRQNLALGAWTNHHNLDDRLAQVYETFAVLQTKDRHLASTLSGGEQQMLAVAQALVADPQVLLVDEPSLGLAPLLVDAVLETLAEYAHQHGIAVLLAEQAVTQIVRFADTMAVMDRGTVVSCQPVSEIGSTDTLVARYLGT